MLAISLGFTHWAQPCYVDPNQTQVVDRVQNALKSVDTDSHVVLGGLILLSSLSIDFMMLQMLYSISKRKNYSLYLAVMIFYALRWLI
jgi:hypothetical protein